MNRRTFMWTLGSILPAAVVARRWPGVVEPMRKRLLNYVAIKTVAVAVIDVDVSYVDVKGHTLTVRRLTTQIAGRGETTLMHSDASERQLKHIALRNTSQKDVPVEVMVRGTVSEKVVLWPGDSLIWRDDMLFHYDVSGDRR